MIDQLSRAPLVIDIMAICLVGLVPIVAVAVMLVRMKKYKAHKMLMQITGTGMGSLLIWFEIKMRTFGWRQYAEESPYYEAWLMPSLILHLLFAIPMFLLWIITIFGALRNFGNPLQPSKYSKIHKRQGRLVITLSSGTGLTAWLFYWLAFVAK